MINSALNLVPGAVGQQRPQIISAVISSTQPAPASYADPLFVVNPAQPDNFWRVDDWTVDHGGTLPQQGAACALFYDYTGTLRCIWWEGQYSPPAPEPVTGAAWVAPTLLNSWANFGSAFETIGYLKDPLGFVHLKGVATGGATNTIAFMLPAGYRPGAKTSHPAAGVTATVNIDTSGNVTLNFSSGTVGLSGLSFLAEN